MVGPLIKTLELSVIASVLLPFKVGWLNRVPRLLAVPVPVILVVPVRLKVPGVMVVPMYWAPEAEAIVGAVPTFRVKAEEPLFAVLVSSCM